MISVANRWQSEIRVPADGAQPLSASNGVTITAGATPHTKTGWVDIIGTSDWSGFVGDAFEIEINFNSANTSATVTRILADIGIDDGGGYVSIIDNLSASYAYQWFNTGFGITYKFPLRVENGVKVGCRIQALQASQAVGCCIILRGNPSNPGLVRAGTFVRTFGADTANSQGTAVTRGTASEPAWTAFATTADDLWFWDCCEMFDDGALNNGSSSCDLAVGGSGSEVKIGTSFRFSRAGTEGLGKPAEGFVWDVPSGSAMSLRMQATSGETGETMILYAVGGNYELPDAANATGIVTVDGSPAANGKTVEIFARDADGVIELIGSTTTSGGTGAFSLGVPDTTRSYWAKYEDGTDVGCSLEGTPGSDDLDIDIGGGGGGSPVQTIAGPRIVQDNVLRKYGA